MYLLSLFFTFFKCIKKRVFLMVSASKTRKTLKFWEDYIFIILDSTIPFSLGKVKTKPENHFGLT